MQHTVNLPIAFSQKVNCVSRVLEPSSLHGKLKTSAALYITYTHQPVWGFMIKSPQQTSIPSRNLLCVDLFAIIALIDLFFKLPTSSHSRNDETG